MVRDIRIKPVLNGFVCEVGCQTVVFNDLSDMTNQIKRYYKNPEEVEKEFITACLNKTMGNPCVPNPAYVTPPQPMPTECSAVVGEPMRR